MKRLTIVVVVLALIYSAYWVIGARTVEQTAGDQLAGLQAQGWQVGYSDLGVRGFPSRFDTTIDDVDIASPDGAIRYAAPFVQAFALAYQPNQVIVALPNSQTVTVGGEDSVVTSDGLRASLSVNANTALSLRDIAAEAQSITLSNPTLGDVSLTSFLTALREAGDLPNSYAAYLNAQSITLPAPLLDQLKYAGMPDAVDVVTLDATVVLDRPLNRHTLPEWETDPGRLRGLTLRNATIRWGDLVVSGTGDLTVDDTGTPKGEIIFSATQWQKMVNVAIELGLIPGDMRHMAASVGQNLSGGSDNLELPVRFQNGNWAVGPFPLGLAPKF